MLFPKTQLIRRIILLTSISLLASPLGAETLRIAVASNFTNALGELAELFEQQSGHKLHLSSGATGKHFAQIRHGAPFDLFFAADTQRPMKLEALGNAIANSRFTYAVGRLTLWSPNGNEPHKQLQNGAFERLAIANPRLAPYGLAAQQTLQKMGIWDDFQARLVRGENIGQTFHFVHSGSAQLGLVALSQVIDPKHAARGRYWVVPTSMHQPIEQQAVQIRATPAGEAFLHFVRSQQAAAIIERHGYEVPD